MARRCIFVILDGLGDRPYPELGHQTPLQAAHTPNLDALASQAGCGMLHADRPGRALPSECAHFGLFGYRVEDLPGRGLLEALGAGIEVPPDGVAVLAHLVSAASDKNQEMLLTREKPPCTADEADQLVAAISTCTTAEGGIKFYRTSGLHGVVIISEPASPQITDTDPCCEAVKIIEPQAWRRALNQDLARRTAQGLKEYQVWAFNTLGVHPVNQARRQRGEESINFVVTQRAGQFRAVEPFADRWGMRGLSLSSGLVYKGLCEYLGIEHRRMTDGPDPGEDLALRLEEALDEQGPYDFIHVHTKAPDVAAHSKVPANKVRAIELLDQGIGRVLPHLLNSRDLVIITADHSTPSSGPLIHSGEPVPLLMLGPGIRRDEVERFSEISCAAGALGMLRGGDLMHVVLNALDRIKLATLMDTPDDQPFWPGKRKAFTL